MKSKIILVIFVFVLCSCFSVFLAKFTFNTDFPVLYRAGKVILDKSTPNYLIYDIETLIKYSVPEIVEPEVIYNFHYIWSMPVAYLLVPLTLMPYFMAKAFVILINILMYIMAVSILLRLGGTSGRWFVYPLALSCLWWPFIQNLRLGNINALLLYLVSGAVYLAIKNRPNLCGILLAIASLFKLFPIAFAMLLGLKNWRIFTSCFVVFSASFLVPDSLKWFSAIGNVYKSYTILYLGIQHFSIIWFGLYAVAIAGFTALLAYRNRGTSYFLLTSFFIPAVYLTLPIVEYHHFTLLMFSYVYLLVSLDRTHRLLITSVILSFLMINSSFFIRPFFSEAFRFIGLFILWAVLGWRLYVKSFLSIKIH